MADSLAPEIVLGKGHGFPADWYNLNLDKTIDSL
jgi:hypothetical protein